ncbi:MAG TPA: hypothetical protein VHQ69_13265 [Methylomirabilota bacterium]|jgi:hypothetical protein|nr:hypothetical protein [Methylomirabilota bacterium]
MSIALPWSEFKAYVAEVGPGRGRVARPGQCLFCDGEHVWFNGWRWVLVTLLVDGQPHRLTDWLPLQRVRCAQSPCGRSWTLRPPWLYPHRSLEPDLAETAALAYLADPQATYRSVAQRVGCSWGTVWLWVGWLATLVTPAAVLARVARLAPHAALPALLPRTVAAAARARSRRRADTVLRAYQVLVAVAMLHRAQPEPAADPSPLRWFLLDQFLTFRRLARLTRPAFSPAFDTARTRRRR